MFLSDEIDEGATRRRLDEITSAGLRALGEHGDRAAQIAKEFQAARAKQDAAAKEMDKLVAEAAAKQQERRAREPQPSPWSRREAKPNVMSIGEEFTEEAVTAPMPAQPQAMGMLPVPIPPEPPAAPPSMRPEERVLSLGYAGEEDSARDRQPSAPPPAARPRPVRRPGPEDDDDMSGRSWMR